MSNYVFVLDTNKQMLNPVHPGKARRLLSQQEAAVFRRYPFTIILKKEVKEEEKCDIKPLQLKIDPGSKTTGLAILNGSKVIWAAELTHRGQDIKARLLRRHQLRRGRRNRKTRYRAPRFDNRTRAKGWLPPSLMHRVLTTMTWVKRLCRYAPIASISVELVRFDTQALQNPEISDTEYQQGTLAGYEVREYLLEKWGRKCVYCKAENTPLQIDHIQPRSRGGSDRVSNLTLACESCNKAKGNLSVQEFLSGKPDLLEQILAQAKAPLKDAAAVNSTRWALFNALKATGLPVSPGSGGQTKYNRTRLNLPKRHWLDAACVGTVNRLEILTTKPLLIKATGHGTRQMCVTDKYGFPTCHRSRIKIHKGFQTGDIVVAKVTKGKKIGSYLGRVICRASGRFDIATKAGRVSGISHKYCKLIHRRDGYTYAF